MATDNPSELLPSATTIQRAVQQGERLALDFVSEYCNRIERLDSQVHAFLAFDKAAALAQASAVDNKRKAGKPLGKLAGVPIAIKDVLCTRGESTTCGSRMLEHFKPPYDAHVIERLRTEDAILIGRVNMDEFAMGSSTENSAYGPTYNPWDLQRVPGGSSGGSAAAVAADFAPLSLGTDTGGSIRQPASYCGVVGLKPTYGRVSRYGLVAYASSLDQIGPLAWTVEDAALLMNVLAGHDPRDATCQDQPVPDYLAYLNKKSPLTIGVPKEYFAAGLDPEVESSIRTALDVYQDAGCKLVDVSLPNAKYAVATYYLVATAEASSNLARYDGIHYGFRASRFRDMIDLYCQTRGQGFGPEVKRRIMLGTFALSAGYRDAYYVKALKVRRLIQDDYLNVFKQVDLIAGPVAPTPAFRVGEKTSDPLSMYLTDIYTIATNLAGIPAISVPCGFSKVGLPIGLHLQGKPFEEETLLRAGHWYQQMTQWQHRRPPLR